MCRYSVAPSVHGIVAVRLNSGEYGNTERSQKRRQHQRSHDSAEKAADALGPVCFHDAIEVRREVLVRLHSGLDRVEGKSNGGGNERGGVCQKSRPVLFEWLWKDVDCPGAVDLTSDARNASWFSHDVSIRP